MMQDDDGRLVEAIARALFNHWRHPAQRPWEWGVDLPEHVTDYWRQGARSALAAIEREGWKVVQVEREYPTSEEVIAYIKAHPEEVGANLRKNNALYRHLSAAPKQG